MCEDPMKYNLLRLKPRQLSGLLHDLGADCQGKPLQLTWIPAAPEYI